MVHTRSMARSNEHYGHMQQHSGGHVSRYHQIVGHLSRHGGKYLNAGYHLTKRAYNYYNSKKKHAHNHEQAMRGDDVQAGISSDKLTAWLHKPLHRFVKGSFARLHECYALGAVGTSGVQSFATLCEGGTVDQAIGKIANTVDAFNYAVPGYQIIPDTAYNSNGYYGASAVPLNQKFALKHTQLNIMMSELANVSCTVKVFVVKAKQNVPKPASGVAGQFVATNAIDVWQRELVVEGLGVTTQTFTTDGATAQIGTENYQMPGASPTDCKGFKKFFSVVGTHTVHLAPGATEELHIDIHNNMPLDLGKILTMQQVTPSTSPLLIDPKNFNVHFLKGGFSVFAIVLGAPVKEQVAGTYLSPYTYGVTEVAFTVNRKTAYVGMPNKQAELTVIQAKDAVIAGEVVGNLKTMNASNVSGVTQAFV